MPRKKAKKPKGLRGEVNLFGDGGLRKKERHECVGRRVRIWWNADEFYDGSIEFYGGDGGSARERERGKHWVKYDDGEARYERLFGRCATMTWEFLPDGPPTKKKKAPRKKSTGFDLGRD